MVSCYVAFDPNMLHSPFPFGILAFLAGISWVRMGGSNTPNIVRYAHFLPLMRRTIDSFMVILLLMNESFFGSSLAMEHRLSFGKLFKGWRSCRYFGRNLGSLILTLRPSVACVIDFPPEDRSTMASSTFRTSSSSVGCERSL
jgi:hypothetical protein